MAMFPKGVQTPSESILKEDMACVEYRLDQLRVLLHRDIFQLLDELGGDSVVSIALDLPQPTLLLSAANVAVDALVAVDASGLLGKEDAGLAFTPFMLLLDGQAGICSAGSTLAVPALCRVHGVGRRLVFGEGYAAIHDVQQS